MSISTRRKFIASTAAGLAGLAASRYQLSAAPAPVAAVGQPLVISTWDTGLAANLGAWKVLRPGGRALDAVEAGVMVTEASQNCCVGLGGIRTATAS